MDFDVLIIGCGVIGAACAEALAAYDLRLGILEADNDVANGTTKANSAIIHAGYDPAPGTIMARLNVAGNARAEALCRRLDVPFRRIGSLVLALEEADLPTLRTLYERGLANGVPELKLLSREETLALEPNASPEVLGSLYAPSAGIVNPWELCYALAETAVRNGASLMLETPVLGASPIEGGWAVMTWSEYNTWRDQK